MSPNYWWEARHLNNDLLHHQIKTKTGPLCGWTKPPWRFQTGAQISRKIQQASGIVARFTLVRSWDDLVDAERQFVPNFLTDKLSFLITGNYAGKWETTNCFKNLGYICKMPGGQNVKPTAAPGETLMKLSEQNIGVCLSRCQCYAQLRVCVCVCVSTAHSKWMCQIRWMASPLLQMFLCRLALWWRLSPVWWSLLSLWVGIRQDVAGGRNLLYVSEWTSG